MLLPPAWKLHLRQPTPRGQKSSNLRVKFAVIDTANLVTRKCWNETDESNALNADRLWFVVLDTTTDLAIVVKHHLSESPKKRCRHNGSALVTPPAPKIHLTMSRITVIFVPRLAAHAAGQPKVRVVLNSRIGTIACGQICYWNSWVFTSTPDIYIYIYIYIFAMN